VIIVLFEHSNPVIILFERQSVFVYSLVFDRNMLFVSLLVLPLDIASFLQILQFVFHVPSLFLILSFLIPTFHYWLSYKLHSFLSSVFQSSFSLLSVFLHSIPFVISSAFLL